MTAFPTARSAADAWTTRERQEAARNAYLASVEAGTPLTGAELGRQFGCTDRWGRLQIRKFRAELDPGDAGGTVGGLSADRNGDGIGGRELSARRDGRTPGRKDTVVPLTSRASTARGGRPDGTRPASALKPPMPMLPLRPERRLGRNGRQRRRFRTPLRRNRAVPGSIRW